jgi:hypothetical protein
MHALDNQMHFTISGSSVLFVFCFFFYTKFKGVHRKNNSKSNSKNNKKTQPKLKVRMKSSNINTKFGCFSRQRDDFF